MECDVAVLGGGPGGYTAAIRAAQLGGKVACIEAEPKLGGTCLRVGCIPTKAWVQSAHAYHDARETFAKLGVQTADPSLDFGTVVSWKDAVVDQMTGGVASLFKANGVEWVNGKGTFTGANTGTITFYCPLPINGNTEFDAFNDNDMTMIVFNLSEEGNIARVVVGEKIGTTVARDA